MQRLRILVTGAGGAAAVAFYQAIKTLNHEVFMGDMNSHSAGMYLVQRKYRFLLKAADHKQFIQHLLHFCQFNQIDVLVPTVDAELIAIAKHRAEFERLGVKIITSEAKVLSTVLDKYHLMKALSQSFKLAWFAKYTTHSDVSQWSFPLIAKPRCDSGSRGIRLIEKAEDLRNIPDDGSYLVQARLPNNEFSVDVYINQQGRAISSVIRERMKTYGGVAVMAKTIHWPLLNNLAAKMAEHLDLRYAVNVQFKLNDEGVPCLLEINPRFPGTASLTVAAGVNMPQMAIQEATGGQLNAFYNYEELAMARCWQEIYMPHHEVMVQLPESVVSA